MQNATLLCHNLKSRNIMNNIGRGAHRELSLEFAKPTR
jgi:hypothetical protein